MKPQKESIGRRATRTFFASVVGKFVSVFITILGFIIIARLLGPSNYGVYTVAIGYATLIGAVSIFGIAAYFDRNIAAMSYRKDSAGMARVLVNGYSIVVPVSIILASVGILLSGFMASSVLQNSNVQALTLVLVSIDLMFSTIWGASFSALIGFGKGKFASIALVALGIVQLLVGVALIYQGYGVNGAIAGLLVGDFVGFLLTSYYVYISLKEHGEIRFLRPSLAQIKSTLMFALPVASTNVLLSGVVSFGTLFLSIYAPTYILGNYGTALKGLGMMNVIYGTLAIVLIQSFSTLFSLTKKSKKIADTYNKTIAYSLLLNLPVVVFVGAFSKPLVYLFLGASYFLAPLYLTIIAMGTSLIIIISFTQSFYIASGNVKRLMKISLTAVVIEVASLLLLVPTFGAIGALASLYIVGSVSTMLLFVRGLKKDFGIRMDYKRLLSLFVSSLILAAIVSGLLAIPGNALELIAGLVAVALLYPPLLVLFRAVDSKTLDELIHLVHNIPLINTTMRQLDRYVRFFIMILDSKG